MTDEKFINDATTVLKFIQLYCDNNHKDAPKNSATKSLVYREKDLEKGLSYHLCEACEKTFTISYENLQACPHEEKPSCRKCPAPCYDKTDWKALARIMKYSGMRLGLNKIRRLFTRQ